MNLLERYDNKRKIEFKHKKQTIIIVCVSIYEEFLWIVRSKTNLDILENSIDSD